MLAEFAALEARDPRRMQRATQVIGHLLRNQFLHVEDRGSSILLETLLRPDMERLIASYFDVAGYRLIVRESEGFAHGCHDAERAGRLEQTAYRFSSDDAIRVRERLARGVTPGESQVAEPPSDAARAVVRQARPGASRPAGA